MNITIAVTDNRAELGKIKQGDTDAWRIFNGSFRNITTTPEELSNLIRRGYAYTTQHNRYRSADNFIQGQHIALDMDTGDERSSIAALQSDPFIARYASFIHTTPSHTVDHPKARVVFCLDRPIKDVGKYVELTRALVFRFPDADQSAKDAARFFYGAKGCDVLWIGNILTLQNAARELVFPYREHLERQRQEVVQPGAIVSSSDVPERVLEKHRNSLLDRVQNAPDGEKYVTLRNTAITFGGYVAGGYYDRFQVAGWLQGAIRSNRNNVQDLESAYRTIDESLSFGMVKPLYFEMRDNGHEPQAEVPELARVNPPLTTEQQRQVIAVIRDREWKAYHDGMTQAQRELWHKQGLDDGIIDMLSLGYKVPEVDQDTGEIGESSLTIPFMDAFGNVTNIEYRHPDNTIDYADYHTPSFYFPEPQDKDTPLIVLPDSLTAIKAWLNYGHVYRVAGLPHMRANATMLEGQGDVVIILEPSTDAREYGLGTLKDGAKFLRLPFRVEKMMGYGLQPEQLGQYLKYARRIVA